MGHINNSNNLMYTRRGGSVWKAPSLSVVFKIGVVAYSLSLSLRIFSPATTTSTTVQQLLEEYSVPPTTATTRTRVVSIVKTQQQQQKDPARQRRRMSIANNSSNNVTHPALLACSCHNNNSVCNEETVSILSRDASRIPTYVEGCPHTTYFGFVWRDLVNRLYPKRRSSLLGKQQRMSPKQSWIVSNVAFQASRNHNDTLQQQQQQQQQQHVWEEQLPQLQQAYGYNVPASVYLTARARGYPVQAIPEKDGSTTTTTSSNHDNLLMVLFDPENVTRQDEIILSHLQQHQTVDYIIYKMVVTPHVIHGQEASTALLDLGYQLQLLSVSHALPVTAPWRYRPNRILSTQVEWLQFWNHAKNMITKIATTTNQKDPWFMAYVMATKSGDMAIPSAQEYINLTGMEKADVLLNVDGDGIPYQTCRRKSSVASIEWWWNWYWNNHTTNAATTGNLTNSSSTIPWSSLRSSAKRHLVQDKQQQQEQVVMAHCANGKHPKSIWYSGSTPETSEIACVDCPNPTLLLLDTDKQESVACVTRFVESTATAKSDEKVEKATNINYSTNVSSSPQRQKQKPNILFVLLEQVSRDRFMKLLPMTRAALSDGGLWLMEHYMASSTSPQEQLQVLVHGDDKNGTRPLSSLLVDSGYATLSAGNGCNASLFETIPDNFQWHGSQFNDMMCRRLPSRPNCIGSTSAAQHLLDYSNEFIQHYASQNKTWAAFLSLVEGRDETAILAGSLDKALMTFFKQVQGNMTQDQWDSTLVVVTSDTGVTRGSFALSFTGQQELIQPLLYLKAPNTRGTSAVKFNKLRYATAYDLHDTLVTTVLLGGKDGKNGNSTSSGSNEMGESLLKPLPDNRKTCRDTKSIPESFCDLVDESSQKSKQAQKAISIEAPPPPSILSFFADIPKPNRNHVHVETKRVLPKRANVTAGCYCATNADRWFPCDVHPWDTHSLTRFKEFFMLVECPDQPTHLELGVVKNPVLINRMNGRKPAEPSKKLPNVIFLELDSVSGSYADRHFPKTREFLKRYRIHRKSGSAGYDCLDGVCSADFTQRISLAGANSIPNQVAALSGCLSSDFDHTCGLEEPDANMYCNDTNEAHYGLQIHRVRLGARQIYWCPPQPNNTQRMTPWMFGITDSLGYVNYFGEEFCYEGSPYVTQGNVFPAFFSDISPHTVFCRLAEQRIRIENKTVPDEHRWGFEKQDQACIDSNASDCAFEKARISLELMEQMWNVYADRPKFAFLNVLAAHVYNADWSKVFLAAERYDEHLSAFLENMVSREDFSNTVIVIRSDHGLQRGPTAMNYNLQIEHTRPWTEVLVPESLPGLSKKALFENQNRLTSGYDLYHTLRSLMEVNDPSKPLPPLPDWTYDLFSATVPADRTCRDARVDEELCRERSIVPSFGICNALDSKQGRFCRGYEVKAVVATEDRLPRIQKLNTTVVIRMTKNTTNEDRAASVQGKMKKYLLWAMNISS